MKILKCKATLIEEMLGTCSADPEIHKEYIASLAPDAPSKEEEVAALGVSEMVEKSMTVFPRLNDKPDGQPFIWDYQIKGTLKEATKALARVGGTAASGTKAYLKIINDLVFPAPRKIPINYEGAEKGIVGNTQRPLRGQTAQGERIALANSQTVPAGATFDFEITLLEEKYEKLVREALDYTKFKGFLQWRNSGKGRVKIEILE